MEEMETIGMAKEAESSTETREHLEIMPSSDCNDIMNEIKQLYQKINALETTQQKIQNDLSNVQEELKVLKQANEIKSKTPSTNTGTPALPNTFCDFPPPPVEHNEENSEQIKSGLTGLQDMLKHAPLGKTQSLKPITNAGTPTPSTNLCRTQSVPPPPPTSVLKRHVAHVQLESKQTADMSTNS